MREIACEKNVPFEIIIQTESTYKKEFISLNKTIKSKF